MTVRDAEATSRRPRASGRAALPPMPRDVPMPGTFGDWYDLAAANLGSAERRDSSGWRMVAGLGMLTGTVLGLVMAAEQVTVLLGYGHDGERADIASIVVGGLLVAGTQVWWWRYRRDWGTARRLRRAWSRALRSPEVLALPAREGQPSDGVDPEARHPYRARRHETLPVDVGVVPTGGPGGSLDVVRALLYPLVFCLGLVLTAATTDVADLRDGADLAPVGMLVLLVGFFATVRAWRRLGGGWSVSALDGDDHARWRGWRVLSGLENAAERPRPWWQRLNLAMLPIAVGGSIVFAVRIASGSMTFLAVWVGVGIVVVPILVVYGSFAVRLLAGRVRARGVEVAVRVTSDDVPPLGPVVTPPGSAVLALGDAPVLRPADGTAVALDGAALISGAPHVLAARRHWLVLTDGSQVPLVCADVRRLRRLAGSAGLRVL